MLRILTIGAACLLGAGAASATPIYLNYLNTTVSLGPGMDPEPFENHTTAQALSRAVDAPSADAEEIHNSPGSHIWVSGSPLTMIFEFDAEYDLSTLHFWNYNGEGYDVDDIDFLFFDGAGTQVGTLDFQPDLGTSGGLNSQDYALSFPSRVKSVEATFTGDNGETDWNNIGFTAELSPPASTVPVPAAAPLLAAAVAGFALIRRRRG